MRHQVVHRVHVVLDRLADAGRAPVAEPAERDAAEPLDEPPPHRQLEVEVRAVGECARDPG